MSFKFFFILFNLCKYCQFKLTPVEEDLSRISLSLCMKEASNQYFSGDLIFVATRTENSSTYTEINYHILSSSWKVTIWDVTRPALSVFPIFYAIQNYLIQFQDGYEMIQELESMKDSPVLNSHGRFFFVSLTSFEDPEKEILMINQGLVDTQLLNAVVFLLDPKDKTRFNAYVVLPYQNGNCNQASFNVTMLDQCSFGTFVHGYDLFMEKIPKKFSDCSINVSAVNWPPYVMNIQDNTNDTLQERDTSNGFEINLLTMIANIMNLKLHYVLSGTWGNVFLNGTVTENFIHLRQRRTDIAVGAFAKTFNRSLYFDTSIPYFLDSLIWCVPHVAVPREMSQIANVLDTSLYFIISFFYAFVSVMMYLLSRKNENERQIYKDFQTCLHKNMAVIFGTPAHTLPLSTGVRIFMGSFILFSVHFVMCYQTYLTSVLAIQAFDEQYQSVADIYESNLKTYFIPTSSMYFEADEESEDVLLVRKIKEHWIDCIDLDYCLGRVALKKDGAMCMPRLFMEYVFNNYMTTNNVPLLYCFKDTVVTYPITIYTRKGFPLFKRMNELIAKIIDAGFLVKWENDIFLKKYENFSTFLDGDEELEMSTLSFSKLRPVLVIHLISCILCVMALLIEVVYYKYLNVPQTSVKA